MEVSQTLLPSKCHKFFIFYFKSFFNKQIDRTKHAMPGIARQVSLTAITELKTWHMAKQVSIQLVGGSPIHFTA